MPAIGLVDDDNSARFIWLPALDGQGLSTLIHENIFSQILTV